MKKLLVLLALLVVLVPTTVVAGQHQSTWVLYDPPTNTVQIDRNQVTIKFPNAGFKVDWGQPTWYYFFYFHHSCRVNITVWQVNNNTPSAQIITTLSHTYQVPWNLSLPVFINGHCYH